MKILLIAILATACGMEVKPLDNDEESTTKEIYHPGANEENDHMAARLVNTMAAIPECKADTAGSLIYILDEEIFKVCDGKLWNNIDLKGKDGDDGEDYAEPEEEPCLWQYSVVGAYEMKSGNCHEDGEHRQYMRETGVTDWFLTSYIQYQIAMIDGVEYRCYKYTYGKNYLSGVVTETSYDSQCNPI